MTTVGDRMNDGPPRPVKKARRSRSEIEKEKTNKYNALETELLDKQKASCQLRPGPYPAVCYKCSSPGNNKTDLFACRQEHCHKYFHVACVDVHGESLENVCCGACSSDNRKCASPRCKTPDDEDLTKCPHEFCDLFFHQNCLEELNAEIKDLYESVRGIVAKEGHIHDPPLLDILTCPRHRCSTCVEARRFPSNSQAGCEMDLRLVICQNCTNAVHNNPRCIPADFRLNKFNPLPMTCCNHPVASMQSHWKDRKLQLKFVGFGYGDFTRNAFKQGKEIGQYVGEVISRKEFEKRRKDLRTNEIRRQRKADFVRGTQVRIRDMNKKKACHEIRSHWF